MRDLGGKVAVVTGAASGIGRATATRLAEEGMKVVMADIEEAALEGAVAELAGAGHEVLGVPTDVSDWEAVSRLADSTMKAFGGVNVVHNNAGVVVSGPVAELTLADWEWVLGVDLWSVVYGVKAFLPLIRKAGEGHIVNTASTAGLQASETIAPYNVAKFGVVALTETLRAEGARLGRLRHLRFGAVSRCHQHPDRQQQAKPGQRVGPASPEFRCRARVRSPRGSIAGGGGYGPGRGCRHGGQRHPHEGVLDRHAPAMGRRAQSARGRHGAGPVTCQGVWRLSRESS